MLTPSQRALLPLLSPAVQGEGWVLAGGTALALRHGHRASEDFDLFRAADFDPIALASEVSARLPQTSVVAASDGTLHLSVGGVRVSFLRFVPALLEEPEETEGLPLARDLDIGAMKLSAVSGRGSRKDFVDLYLLATEGPGLSDLLDAFDRKFAGVRVERAHVLRSLSYFDDAEREPMPRLLRPWTWEEIRAYWEARAKDLTRRGGF